MISIKLPEHDQHDLAVVVNSIGEEFRGVEKLVYMAVANELMNRLRQEKYEHESCLKRLDAEVNKNKEK